MKTFAFDGLCSRLVTHWDANLDGAITVTDIWLNLKFAFFLPANIALAALDGTNVGRFFEIDCFTGYGLGSALFSVAVWLVLFGSLASEASSGQKRGPAK